MKLFNIIVPVYNETSSIVDFLNSFYSNNISEIKDFGELVIVNDGSNDDTLNNLENYKLNKNRKIISYPKNSGYVCIESRYFIFNE